MAIPAGGAVLAGPVPDVSPGLDALRHGRFEEAQASFERLSAEQPGAPEGPFFEAFHLWWRLLDRPEGAEGDRVRALMEARLEEAARRARETPQDAGPPERPLVYIGMSLLLEAQSRAARGAHLSAASAARQGHRVLSEALVIAPHSADALFAMGAYNYFSDNVPLLVKGLRVFLLIPGGDEKKGIAQLEEAAAGSRLFGAEALMLLSHIFSGHYEEDYARALGYSARAATMYPASPLMRLAHADMLFKVGRLKEAAERAGSAYDSARDDPRYPPDLARYAAYRLAACTLKLHDPLTALELTEAGLRDSLPSGGAETRRWMALLGWASRDCGRPDRLRHWMDRLSLPEDDVALLKRRFLDPPVDPVAPARAVALRALASGRTADAERQLGELLGRHPRDPRLHYHLGRLLQQQGRLPEARPHLEAAATAGTKASSADLTGWAMVRLGWGLESEGKRREAVAFYRRAADLRQFTFHAFARVLLAAPAGSQPEG